MNIILVPEGIRKGPPACLSHRHLLAVVLVGLIALPLLLGVIAYRVEYLLDGTHGQSEIAQQERALAAQRAAIAETKKNTEAHLNALARRLGEMQAEMLRLNALGSRLTKMAGLDPREFSFDTPPAVGGPERSVVAKNAPQAASLNAFDTLDKLSAQIDRQRERLVAMESVMLDKNLNARVTPSGWPVDGGWMSSAFGLRVDPFTGHQAFHEGVDIASRLGSPIYAMGDGVITHVGDKDGYGLCVEMTHESGLITRYAHTRAILVKEGDRVAKGQTIALVGSSGRSTGPHLHFEVVKNGVATNPHRYLQQNDTLPRVANAQ
jgi:murein DD-endopeptidase MepM/ murein hydrolase activator NlpD